MSVARDELRSRNLRTIFALAALFLLPLAASFWLYYGVGWRPAATTNHGELIQPPRPLPVVTLNAADARASVHDVFSRQWSLVYVGDGRCEPACRHALYVMRQTRIALNNDMARMKRVFLATGGCCDREFLEREHAGLLVLDASGEAAAPVLALFPNEDRANSVFIVDPLGNLMMRYDARRNPRGLFDDLKTLLLLSHIG
jgi:hypothetical protein